MSLMVVAVAFASLSAAQAGEVGSGISANDLSQSNRTTPVGPNSEPGTAANGERLVCRRVTISGTHRYRRVCLTAEQWRQQQD